MKLYLDTADIKEVERWVCAGVISGVTTNPAIIRRDAPNVDVRQHIGAMAELMARRDDGVVSVQLADKFDSAAEWLLLGDNVIVKTPMVDWGIDAAGLVPSDRINITAVMSMAQAIVGLALAPRILSVFWGRIGDYQMSDIRDPNPGALDTLKRIVDYRDSGALYATDGTDILVGSIRCAADVVAAAEAGADICTVSPKVLREMMQHPATDKILGEWYG